MSASAQTTNIRATAQHPGFAGRTVAGTLRVNSGQLEFHGDSVAVGFPLSGLKIDAGGHNNEQLFFQHPSHPDWLISTSDRSIAAVLSEHASDLRGQLATAANSRATSSRLLIATTVCVGGLLVFLLVLFAMKSTLAGLAVSQIPLAWEQKLGDAVFESVKAQSKTVENTDYKAQMDAVTSRLLAAITNVDYGFRFHVIEAEELNAFAIPGGHVVVHTGLLKAVEQPEELAGVLAHEMAHVTQRHSLRNMVESAGLALIVQTIFGDASGLIALASGGSEFLLRQKFSRDTERDADDVGWDYLLAANINPRGMISFFDKLKKQTENNPAAAAADHLNLMSTHPATPERIARLEAKWKELGQTNAFVPICVGWNGRTNNDEVN